MYSMREFAVHFWDPKIWLPGITWEDIKSNEDVIYADYKDLWVAIPAAMVLLLVRFVMVNYAFSALGVYLGMAKPTSAKVQHNAVLEYAYQTENHINAFKMAVLAKKLGVTKGEVQRWFRARMAADKPPLLRKFGECIWRFLYYTYSSLFGIVYLWDKPWLWDVNYCWYNYPFHPITWNGWLYYVQSVAFYISATISHFFEAKRKDFWQMLAHHILTLTLLCFSWTCHFHRVGSSILLVHDLADIFVESTKASKYAGYQRVSDVTFVMLALTWSVTRLFVYPMLIVYKGMVEGPKFVPIFPAYYFFSFMLLSLLVFNYLWAYVILNMALDMCKAGQMVRDLRSDSDLDSSDNSNTRRPVVKHARKYGTRKSLKHKGVNRSDRSLALLVMAVIVLIPIVCHVKFNLKQPLTSNLQQ